MRTSKNPTRVNLFKVPSSSTKGKEYTVRELIWDDETEPEVEWKCSCPQSVLKNKTCKHIQKVITDKIESLEKEIGYNQGQIEVAEKYPTETTQFYSALYRQKDNLRRQVKELELLKGQYGR